MIRATIIILLVLHAAVLFAGFLAPYDYAAKKAIELASPLKPLPPDFPKETEHVTAMFYYNSEPPRR